MSFIQSTFDTIPLGEYNKLCTRKVIMYNTALLYSIIKYLTLNLRDSYVLFMSHNRKTCTIHYGNDSKL